MIFNQREKPAPRTVTLEKYDEIQPAYLSLSVVKPRIIYSFATSQGTGRWKLYGGATDGFRDESASLSTNHRIDGDARFTRSKLYCIGAPYNHSQKISLSLYGHPEFDGSDWGHSEGRIVYSDDEAIFDGWLISFSIPSQIFCALIDSIKRKAVPELFVQVDAKAFGPSFGDSDYKLQKAASEAYIKSISWADYPNSEE